MFSAASFNLFLIVMAAVAVVVFVSLFFVDAGYGKFYNPKWGPSVDNHWGWFLMEAPVFIVMLGLWWFSDRRNDTVRVAFLLLFELHYFHRSFLFPLQLRGHTAFLASVQPMEQREKSQARLCSSESRQRSSIAQGKPQCFLS